MKRSFLFLFVVLSAPALCQQNYVSGLLAYQQTYKKELASIIRTDTMYVRFFPPDTSYKVSARVEKLSRQPVFNMPTSSGVTKQAVKSLAVTFSIRGKEYKLFGYQLLALLNQEEQKEHFFIPFFDATSSVETYGGGRYLDFNFPDIHNNMLEIDFNMAYNPYCAFVTGYNCPIPPSENSLPVAIYAGEKNFGKKHDK